MKTETEYKKDAKGRLIPVSLIKPIDVAREELVLELIKDAITMREKMIALKQKIFGDINAFCDMSAEQYGVDVGGKKGNITLHSFDGKYKVQVAIAEKMVFDERLLATKAMINDCIHEWSKGSSDEIKVLVQNAFQTDKEGKINMGRVLELRRLEINHPTWLKAMSAIGESLQVIGSKEYVRFYERVEGDKYVPISLDMSSV